MTQGVPLLTYTVLLICSVVVDDALVNIFGSEYIGWIFSVCSSVVVTSRAVFSCTTALFRLMFIKAPYFLKYQVGEKRMTVIMVAISEITVGFMSFSWVFFLRGEYLAGSFNFAKDQSQYQAMIHHNALDQSLYQ